MPLSSATEFISLDRARAQLNASPGDAELTDIVSTAVAWVERRTQSPVLDSTFRLLVERPGHQYPFIPYFAEYALPFYARLQRGDPDSPIAIRARVVRGVPVVRYWAAGQTLNEAPTGSVTPARVEYGDRYAREDEGTATGDDPCLFPPDGGWPEGLDGAPLAVEGTAGFNVAADAPPQFKQAALQVVSALYESPESAEKFFRTAKMLLIPFVRKGS